MTRWRVLVAGSVWVVLSVGLWASDSSPAVLLLGAIVAAVVATIVVTLDLANAGCRIDWTGNPTATPPRPAGDPHVVSLRQQISGATWSGSTQLHDTLVDAVDERLLVHHRIDRATDPAAATAALSPRLRRLVGGQRRREVVPNELRQILTDIESL